MSENEELLRLARDLTPFDIPIGVYVVTKEGRFVKCNRRAREIFRFPLEGEIDDSIARFYPNPEYRNQMHQELLDSEARGKPLEKLLTFEVNGQEIFVQDFTHSLKNEAGDVVGYICCMTDVTEGERSKRLLDSLPAGVYTLDAEDRCEQANRDFARILGYDSPDEIAGQPSSKFYVNPSEATRLREMVESRHPEPVINFIAELRKKDGRETIFANINAQMVEGDDGSYAGREGTIIDVTRQERYRRIMRDVPVGLNSIRHEGDKDIIVDCNEQFVNLFDFRDLDHAKGFNARQLHAPGEYARFRIALEAAARQGRPLVAYRLKVITLTGEEKILEISSQPLTDTENKLIGRTGAIRDITHEAELKDRLDELTYDFGSVLHNYTTTLLMVQLSSEPVIRSLSPDPFPLDREVTPDQASEAIAVPASRLADALAQLLELAKEPGRAPALPGERWERLGELLTTLRDYKEVIAEIDIRPVVLCEVSLHVLEVCGQLARSHKFSRDNIRALREPARELLRITNLISLHQMRDSVLEMDHQVRSLREFVTTNTREPEPKEVCQVSELVRQVRSNLDDYARSRRVEFKIEREEAKVRVVRREMLRALGNLLHNAIKYSWSRDKAKSPWVTIRISVAEGQVKIEFSNWGVPIRKEEIDKELIFKIGYRGRHSGDRGRVGTGIGLADAQRVALAHGGVVEVESHPSVGSRPENDYTQPFVTSVVMKLPIYRDQGVSHEN